MKQFLKTALSGIASEKKIAFSTTRFSYIDSVLDEEYGDHLPFIDPSIRSTKLEKISGSLKNFVAGLLFRVLTYPVFIFYFLFHSSLKAVRLFR